MLGKVYRLLNHVLRIDPALRVTMSIWRPVQTKWQESEQDLTR
jgi:hypothetical protein